MRYRVELNALAVVRGAIVVDAADASSAEELAKGMSGDISWKYDGVQDDSVCVDTCTEWD